jgi:hypothetical protein
MSPHTALLSRYNSDDDPPTESDSSFFAVCTPNVETWHCRLGHCNFYTVVSMARSNVVEGMLIDLSSTPPKCDHCVIGETGLHAGAKGVERK